MTKKSRSIIRDKIPAVAAIVVLLAVWQAATESSVVPEYMLPSPSDVVRAFIEDIDILAENAAITLKEAFAGLVCGVALGFSAAVLMDKFEVFYKAFYPIMVITQTVPTVAIAPLLVLWFGYGMLPKVVLIVISTFFPVAIGVFEGFRSADKDAVGLLRSMGASGFQIFRYVKFPSALPQFFSALRITVAYSVVGAVISEWLGGFGGLGVYMTRVKKAFAFDKMFAVIFFISAVSLLLMLIVGIAEKKCMPYRKTDKEK